MFVPLIHTVKLKEQLKSEMAEKHFSFKLKITQRFKKNKLKVSFH